MSEQQYKPLGRDLPGLYTCQGCGSVVRDMALHDLWHAGSDDTQGEWNPAVVDGDPTTQCTARNGCQCLLGEGHQRDHRCAHGYWINLDSDDTPTEKP